MTELWIFLLLAWVIWLTWRTRRSSKAESEVAALTARLYLLEQEVTRLRTVIQTERQQARPAPSEPAIVPKPAVPSRQISGDTGEPIVSPRPAPSPGPAIKQMAPPVIPSPVSEADPPSPEAFPRFATPEPPFSLRGLMNLEEMLGTNWLNKLGIVILVIGVALFLAYQLRELGPSGKVTVGYGVGAAMLGLGVFFERREKWRLLARAAIAGGWGLLYFTTYAMYHVPATRVMSSEALDLVLLLAAAAAMVAHTLRYQSQVVTGLAFLLAFTTVNISRGNAYSLIASAILAAALAMIAVRRHWFEMELAGIAAAFVNHYLWLRPVIEPMHAHIHDFPGYFASSALLIGYWAIFRASYVVRRIDTPRQEQISTLAAVLNSALLLAVMAYQSVHPELSFRFLLLVGAVELGLGQLPLTRRRRAAFIVLTTLGSCLIAAAFPRRFADTALSITWLAEGEALLLAGVFLKEIVFRRLGLLALLLTWMYMLGGNAGEVFFERMYGNESGGRIGLALFFGLAATVLYGDANWIPRRWRELINTPLEQLCFRRLSHMAGVLGLAAVWIAWPGAWTALGWAALALALSYVGRRWQIRQVSLDGLIMAAIAVVRALSINLFVKSTYSHAPWLTERLLTIALVAAILYLAQRWAGVDGIIAAERIGPLYTWAASGLLSLLAWYELQPIAVSLAWALLGLALLELGLAKGSRHFRFQAYVAFVSSFLRIFFVNLNAGNTSLMTPRLYTVLPLALAFYYVNGRLKNPPADGFTFERNYRIAELHSFLGFISVVALMRFEFDADWVAAAWAAVALGLMVLAWRTRTRLYLHQALLLGFGVLLRAGLHNLYERSYFPAPLGHGPAATVGASTALLFLVLPFAFRLRRLKPVENSANASSWQISSPVWFQRTLELLDRRPEQVFFFIPFALLTAMLAIEVRIGLVTLAWGVESVAVFLLALYAKERSFRLAGLGLLLVCVGKILVRDVWGLAPRDRYLTFIVLGAALLTVSYLYTRYREVLRQYL
jgi:uncharacterized membrane protein